MFILKFTMPCPDIMTEYFYDEVVSVNQGIALVINEHVKNALCTMDSGYVLLGEIDEVKELKSFFAKANLAAREETMKALISQHIVPIEQATLIRPERTEIPENTKTLLDGLE